jgi:hypothetical protein
MHEQQLFRTGLLEILASFLLFMDCKVHVCAIGRVKVWISQHLANIHLCRGVARPAAKFTSLELVDMFVYSAGIILPKITETKALAVEILQTFSCIGRFL